MVHPLYQCDMIILFPVFSNYYGTTECFNFQFGLDLDMYLVRPDGSYKVVPFKDLLPLAFTPASLEAERV